MLSFSFLCAFSFLASFMSSYICSILVWKCPYPKNVASQWLPMMPIRMSSMLIAETLCGVHFSYLLIREQNLFSIAVFLSVKRYQTNR